MGIHKRGINEMHGNTKRALERNSKKVGMLGYILGDMVALKIDQRRLAQLTGLSYELVKKGITNPTHVSMENLELMQTALTQYYLTKRKGV
ncbi:hypothetical protein ACV3J7_20815 [Salmonella enterica]